MGKIQPRPPIRPTGGIKHEPSAGLATFYFVVGVSVLLGFLGLAAILFFKAPDLQSARIGLNAALIGLSGMIVGVAAIWRAFKEMQGDR